jgi:ribosome-associated translation inhibitor RaiA
MWLRPTRVGVYQWVTQHTLHEPFESKLNMKLKNTNDGNQAKINLLYRGLKPRALWESLVSSQIARLQHLASIASARITLERQPDSSAPFRVQAILEVPGPDYHAEATDYTLRAALLNVADNLRRQMKSRKDQQVHRRKNKTRLGFMGGPGYSTP